MREGLFTGKVTEGPVREQFQIKCLDLMGGGELTDEKLESEPSVKLPSPTAPEESEGKTAATKSSVWLDGVASETVATVVICEDEAVFERWMLFARWASFSVRVLYPLPEMVVVHW